MTFPYRLLTDTQLNQLMQREVAVYTERTPTSAQRFKEAQQVLHRGVPMPWMAEWGTPNPIFMERAAGAHLRDVDGNKYTDFCFGDTGSMYGHSPAATAQAITEQATRGITTMLATEDSIAVAKQLQHRFKLPFWQIAMTATDANRCVMRLCRAITGRPKVLVVNQCYHGTLDESLVKLENGQVVKRSIFDHNPGVAADAIARVVEFNDEAALEKALAHGDVACVMMEPVMTNCGMVLPTPTYHQKLRELCTQLGVYLLIDETHTISTGYGGYTAAHGLKPDILVLGKAIAGGIPCAAYGFTEEFKNTFEQKLGALGTAVTAFGEMGIGGTLSANAFVMHVMRATLEHVATEDAYQHMIEGAHYLADGLEQSIARHQIPWSVTRCGARAELQFRPTSPKNGAESLSVLDWDLIMYTHIYLLNRGVMVTPFHNMMLVSPATTHADIDLLINGWDECMAEIAALTR
jgi:glutamate-1-semialdehyde 2,1-aminomutase